MCVFFYFIGSFLGAFLGAFDKYVEILCYFGSFFKVLVAIGSFLERFWPILKVAQKFCAIFCAIFWKLPNSGDLPKFGSSPEFGVFQEIAQKIAQKILCYFKSGQKRP